MLHKPNIILISVDSLRPDFLGCYNSLKDTSANIDKVANSGCLFFSAISQSSWTYPAIHSLITGLYPSTHQVYFYDLFLATPDVTLTHFLKKDNYLTGFISGHGGLGNMKYRFGKELDYFDDSRCSCPELTHKTLTWINSNAADRFFLWIHLMDMHKDVIGVAQDKISADELTEDEIKGCTLKYEGGLKEVDRCIGMLMKTIQDLGLIDNTLVIITADHGQEMGEHSVYFTHGGQLWDSVIKVPLIISFPRLLSGGKKIYNQVQLIDIFPTICEILRIKDSKHCEGKSMLQLLEGGEFIGQSYAFSEHRHQAPQFISTSDWQWSQFSVRTSIWKLIFTIYKDQSRKFLLFNLDEDPREFNNLVDQEKEITLSLIRKLEEWINRGNRKLESASSNFDEETRKNLERLGYL